MIILGLVGVEVNVMNVVFWIGLRGFVCVVFKVVRMVNMVKCVGFLFGIFLCG